MAHTNSIYTKRLGRKVAKEAKGTIGKFHLIPTQANKWSMVADGSLRSFKSFTTKDKALRFARRHVSSINAGQVIVHSSEGKIIAHY
jgi:Uncharacterized protein conserved in bacteria (DUF2188)